VLRSSDGGIFTADVLAFKENRARNRRAGLRELSQMTQEYGGYDPELKSSK
jgi:hypothetical protein